MDKKQLRIRWWGGIAAYLAVVYATLGVAPRIWNALDALFGGLGIIFAVYLPAVLAGIALLAYMFFKKEERRADSYFILLVFVAVFFELTLLAVRPEEKIHLLEYGVLGVLLYNALKIDMDRLDPMLYIAGATFCFGAGLIDEVIQLYLPNRVFDWKDVVINFISGVMGLLIIRVIVLKAPKKPIDMRTRF